MKFKTVLLWQTWGDIRQCIQLFLSRVSLLLAMCCFFCLCTSSTVVWNPNPILINSPRHDTIRVASSRLSRKKKKKEKMLRGWYRSAIISLQRTTAPPPPSIRLPTMLNTRPPVLIWYDKLDAYAVSPRQQHVISALMPTLMTQQALDWRPLPGIIMRYAIKINLRQRQIRDAKRYKMDTVAEWSTSSWVYLVGNVCRFWRAMHH